MRAKQFAAAAMLAIGALGVSTGTAHAGPAAPEVSVRAAEQGIGYVAAPTSDGTGVVATLDAGSFRLTQDATAVVLSDNTGRTVATLPLAVQAFGQTSALAPAISDSGRTLTLTPVNAPRSSEHIAELVDESETLARKQHNAGIGALIGAGIGAVLGFFLGGVGALLTIPIGAGIGALIGYATP
ncbi:hypothetical protein [Nocardia donostiensis]|uniref:DUF8020 domain-containing protein n=1 Tax=Nocardia donostiensis TaxID=1538463 RepID=A0A1V2THR6_9NOCA|nr:hypothetical protein [Nocardia donostiensis]ONM48921.1 hypothetical protein B0T46_10725 [Nocardia donostiensis]OQS15458.1 hypothetical protein B0T36_09315 [Nocardia donostiensis]OQS22823.1 hypothetical protein B0T44_03740 [Nocardia donostiensis]